MRIVRETSVVGAKFLHPSQESSYVIVGISAAGTIWSFGMDADSTQKDRLPIQENLRAARFDGAKSDLIFQRILAGTDGHSVQLGIVRRPQLQTGRMKRNFGATIRSGPRSLREVLLWNLDGDLRAWSSTIHMNPSIEFRFGTASELQSVIIDECVGHFEERYIARDSAVIPPIGLEGRNSIRETRVIDRNDGKVSAIAQKIRDLAVKRREAALILASLLAVDPDVRAVIRRSHMEEDATRRCATVIKVLLVPNRALVEKERITLRVPIPGNMQRGRFGKVIFDRRSASLLLLVFEIPVVTEPSMKIV